MGSIYYFIAFRLARNYIETGSSREYWNWGKFNILLKTLAVLFGYGLAILIGRLIFPAIVN
jgi:hypothetical protein